MTLRLTVLAVIVRDPLRSLVMYLRFCVMPCRCVAVQSFRNVLEVQTERVENEVADVRVLVIPSQALRVVSMAVDVDVYARVTVR